jgi:nitrite reductase/ring-hydroxylating ferredoxin subunit
MGTFLIGRIVVVIVRTLSGSLHGLFGRCPHQGGELGLGLLAGTTLPGEPGEYTYGRQSEVVRCPWHGFEFDVFTGRCLADPERLRVRTFEVSTEGEDVVVEI